MVVDVAVVDVEVVVDVDVVVVADVDVVLVVVVVVVVGVVVVVDVIPLHTDPDEPVNMSALFTLESAWVRARVGVKVRVKVKVRVGVRVRVRANVYLGINPSSPTQRPTKGLCSKEHLNHVDNARHIPLGNVLVEGFSATKHLTHVINA